MAQRTLFPASAGRFRRVLALAGVVLVGAIARPGMSQPPPAGASVAPAPAGAAPAGAASSAAQATPPATAAAAATAPASPFDATKVRAAVADLLGDAKTWGGTASAMVVDVASGAVLASG